MISFISIFRNINQTHNTYLLRCLYENPVSTKSDFYQNIETHYHFFLTGLFSTPSHSDISILYKYRNILNFKEKTNVYLRYAIKFIFNVLFETLFGGLSNRRKMQIKFKRKKNNIKQTKKIASTIFVVHICKNGIHFRKIIIIASNN